MKRFLAAVFLAVGFVLAAIAMRPARQAHAAPIDQTLGAAGSALPLYYSMTGRIGFNGTVQGEHVCDKIALFSSQTIAAAASNAVLVAGVAGQAIWICDISLGVSTATAATAVRLVEGSGTACATSPANLGILQFTTPTTAPTAPNFTLGPFANPLAFTVTTGDSICLQQASTTNATTFVGWIHYTQGA